MRKYKDASPRPAPTNGDMIRGMTDEELARAIVLLHLDEYVNFCKDTPECNDALDGGGIITDEMCCQCCLDWLRAPAETEGTE